MMQFQGAKWHILLLILLSCTESCMQCFHSFKIHRGSYYICSLNTYCEFVCAFCIYFLFCLDYMQNCYIILLSSQRLLKNCCTSCSHCWGLTHYYTCILHTVEFYFSVFVGICMKITDCAAWTVVVVYMLHIKPPVCTGVHIQCEKKSAPPVFWNFSQWLRIFNRNFTCQLTFTSAFNCNILFSYL